MMGEGFITTIGGIRGGKCAEAEGCGRTGSGGEEIGDKIPHYTSFTHKRSSG
jgi:hypothetical protein